MEMDNDVSADLKSELPYDEQGLLAHESSIRIQLPDTCIYVDRHECVDLYGSV